MTDTAKPIAFADRDLEDTAKPPFWLFRNAAAKIALTPMMATVVFIFIGCTVWTIFYSFTTSRVMPTAYPFGKDFADVREGEALVFKPSASGPPVLAARVQANEWIAQAGS